MDIALPGISDYIHDANHDWYHQKVTGRQRRFFEMKVSREQMAQNRLRILDEAGRLFREKEFDAVSVAEVMKAAGMTHGGFYGHFSSKDDLIARTLEHVMKPGAPSSGDFLDYMSAYLSLEHRDNPASGCPTAGDWRRRSAASHLLPAVP